MWRSCLLRDPILNILVLFELNLVIHTWHVSSSRQICLDQEVNQRYLSTAPNPTWSAVKAFEFEEAMGLGNQFWICFTMWTTASA